MNRLLTSLFPVLLFTSVSAGVSWAEDWKLVWSDEFEYAGLPDPEKWGYEVGFVRNKEKQYYTKGRSENARVENGLLTIESRKEKYTADNGTAADYTSASLITRNTAHWKYSRVEVRAQLPTGKGMWPAIWMLGMNIRQVGWPKCGEIDIMENVGYDPQVIHANIHTGGKDKGSRISVKAPYADFHIYAIDWFPTHMDFFVDDQKYFTYKNEGTGEADWPFDQEFYLILNAAIGGNWGGQQGIDDSIFPQKYFIDYVRVYQFQSEVTDFQDRGKQNQ